MAAQSRQQAAPGAFTAFARFVLCGGGVGLASSFAVAALASWIPWVVANALITAVSTLTATELHARSTFGAGGRVRGDLCGDAGPASVGGGTQCGARAGRLSVGLRTRRCSAGSDTGGRASVPAVSASQPMPSTQPARRQTECAYAPDYRPDHGRSAHYNTSPGAVR
ncbi:hypothetical protein GCM10010270_74870 [Streptomyces violaceus]|nr:hypothetical protein GCM10010270_74870 [Streptomyces janthinus]